MILKLPKYVPSLREMHKISTTTDQSAYCQIYQNSYKKKTCTVGSFPFWNDITFSSNKNLVSERTMAQSHATLFFLIYNITESLLSETLTLGVFLDLSKALHTINHSIQLFNLKHSGISGTALYWLESYLTGRMQKIECSGILSNTVNPVKRGVQQG